MRYSAVQHTVLLLVTAAAAAAAGCGGGGGGGATTPPTSPTTPTSPSSPSGAVTVGLSTFTPSDLTVAKGGTVTWTWDSCTAGDGYGAGASCVSHNIVFDDGAPGSGAMSSGTFTRSFSAAGAYPYHCSIHGAAMSGRVVVQ